MTAMVHRRGSLFLGRHSSMPIFTQLRSPQSAITPTLLSNCCNLRNILESCSRRMQMKKKWTMTSTSRPMISPEEATLVQAQAAQRRLSGFSGPPVTCLRLYLVICRGPSP